MWIRQSRQALFLLVKIQWKQENSAPWRRLTVPVPIFIAEDLLESAYDLMTVFERITLRGKRRISWRRVEITPFIKLMSEFLAELRRQGRLNLVHVDVEKVKVGVDLY